MFGHPFAVEHYLNISALGFPQGGVPSRFVPSNCSLIAFNNQNQIKIIYKDDPPETLKVKMQSLDVRHTSHPPSVPDSTRRMTRYRHSKRVNCLCIDGHSDNMNALEITG